MIRVVNADELKTAFPCGETVRTESVRATIDYMATMVDAVEVVRCKDCKFNYANQIPSENACQLCVELPISDEFYCAYGERREDETD